VFVIWLLGLVVLFSRRARQVPGSISGAALDDRSRNVDLARGNIEVRPAIGTGKLNAIGWGRAVIQNAARGFVVSCVTFLAPTRTSATISSEASVAHLVEHALRKQMVVGSIPTGSLSLPHTAASSCASPNEPVKTAHSCGYRAPRLQPASALRLPDATCR
jgi:hypothetical protein